MLQRGCSNFKVMEMDYSEILVGDCILLKALGGYECVRGILMMCQPIIILYSLIGGLYEGQTDNAKLARQCAIIYLQLKSRF